MINQQQAIKAKARPHKITPWMLQVLSVVALASLLLAVSSLTIEEDLLHRLNQSLVVTEDILADIFDEWQIEKFPNFLRVCRML